MARKITVAAAQMGPIQRADDRASVVARLLELMREAHATGRVSPHAPGVPSPPTPAVRSSPSPGLATWRGDHWGRADRWTEALESWQGGGSLGNDRGGGSGGGRGPHPSRAATRAENFALLAQIRQIHARAAPQAAAARSGPQSGLLTGRGDHWERVNWRGAGSGTTQVKRRTPGGGDVAACASVRTCKRARGLD